MIRCFFLLVCLYSTGYSQPVWKRIRAFTSSPKDLNSVKFVNQKTGWAIGINELMKSTDGGLTWQLHYSFSYPDVFPDFHLQVRAMDFADTLHGMLGRTQGEVHITKDGGATFKTVAIPDFAIRGMDVVNPDIAYVCGSSDIINSQALIYKTIDGGDTWTAQLIPTTYGLIDIRFIDSLTGWVCGVGGIFKTTDGGETWLQLGGAPNYGMLQVQFLNADTGYALTGGGILYKSETGGISWLPVAQLDTNGGSGYQSMEFITPSDGMIGNISTGYLFHTLDAGITWDRTNLRLIQDVSFIDATHAWAVGYSDTVSKYAEVPVNTAPQASDDSAWTAMNSPVPINVLANDTDEAGLDTASLQLTVFPAYGTVSILADGLILYTPDNGFTGFDTLGYTICDTATPALCASASVFIVVEDTIQTGHAHFLKDPVGLFPNPASSYVTIRIPEEFSGSILQVYDSGGNLLLAQTLPNETQATIDFSRYRTGLYFIRISNAIASLSAKLIKDQ